jgi:hypothetical protein
MKRKTLGIDEGIRESKTQIDQFSKGILTPIKNFVNMGYPNVLKSNKQLMKRWQFGLWNRVAAFTVLILATAFAVRILFFGF